MNKKIVLIPIVMIIATFVTIFSLDPSERNGNVVFHVTLADSGLYANGVYTDTFTINEGEFSFRFVPNGSSPEILSIILNGKNFDFSEDFKELVLCRCLGEHLLQKKITGGLHVQSNTCTSSNNHVHVHPCWLLGK